MDSRRIPAPAAVGLALLTTALLFLSAGLLRAEEPEVIKGTVISMSPDAIVLSDIGFTDPTMPRKNVRVAVDNATAYYYGATKVTKEAVSPDCRVLVKCTKTGSGRKAHLVRIIGGKAP